MVGYSFIFNYIDTWKIQKSSVDYQPSKTCRKLRVNRIHLLSKRTSRFDTWRYTGSARIFQLHCVRRPNWRYWKAHYQRFKPFPSEPIDRWYIHSRRRSSSYWLVEPSAVKAHNTAKTLWRLRKLRPDCFLYRRNGRNGKALFRGKGLSAVKSLHLVMISVVL